MKKTLMILILTLFLLATAGTVFAEEIAKEGSFSATSSYSSSYVVLPMGNNYQITFEALGLAVTDSEDSPFNNASVRILGSGLVLDGNYNEVGSVSYTLTTGDQVFTKYEMKGIGPGKAIGNFTYIGGTGAFTEISGDGEIKRTNVPKPAMKGTVQGYTKLTGTWKLP